MKIMFVGGGASFSIKDVETGYLHALQRQGHNVIEYMLEQRIEVATRYLKALFNYADQDKPRAERRQPQSSQVLWQACAEIVTRALWHKVDFVFIISGMFLHPDFLVLLRRAKIPNVVVFTESPYSDDHHARLLPYIDVAFTNERASVEPLRRVNPDVYYLPHAYDPATHRPGAQPGDEEVASHDVVFVGTGFQERLDLLSGVDWSGIDLGLYGTYSLLPSRHRLRKYIRGGVTPNATAAALYRRAKVGLNLYRAAPGAASLNPRAVELAACGAFHLSDARAEVGETFCGHVPTFHDARDLGDLIRHYLEHSGVAAIHAACLPQCVRDRTFDAQAAYLVSTLRAAWSGASAAIGA